MLCVYYYYQPTSLYIDHPTYREVSIYARARRMQLRYDSQGRLSQGRYGYNDVILMLIDTYIATTNI